MSHHGDIDLLAQTADWLSRMAELMERVTERLADHVERLDREQAEIRDGMVALSNRIEALTRSQPEPPTDGPAYARPRAVPRRSMGDPLRKVDE